VLTNSTVGRSVLVAGGGGTDSLTVADTLLGAGLAADLGGGTNTTRLIDSLVAGSVRVAGGGGPDEVHVTDASVGGRLAALLGDGDNTLTIDHTASDAVSDDGSIVYGALTYAGGAGRDTLLLGNERPVTLVGPVAIATGDEPGPGDLVILDDTAVLNTLLIDTGTGADSVAFERSNTSFKGVMHLAAGVTIRTGAGNDAVLLGKAATADALVLFAAKPSVDGGPGGSDDLFREHYSIGGVDQAPFPAPGFENILP
jgi:hypothetical protein